ncbi:hypothetical protein C1645_832953 [Glomus cerebriforme]|uniref:Uncharacterized protein n=1 Tax=Glomus cerebriforme TaxID=658196 RepID=A0A397SCG5_9GLOM|nr:hypothetical protein C1645_832953 [Glomus cerebriforme]
MSTQVVSVKVLPIFDVTYSTTFQPYISRQEFNDRICQLNEILIKRQKETPVGLMLLAMLILPIIGHIVVCVDARKRDKRMMKSLKDKLTEFNRKDYGKLHWKVSRSCCKGVRIHLELTARSNGEEATTGFHGREMDYHGNEM